MPLIHIELIEGRTQEQLKNLVADVTDAVTKNTGTRARRFERDAQGPLFGRRRAQERRKISNT